jgi:hypothetical protein
VILESRPAFFAIFGIFLDRKLELEKTKIGGLIINAKKERQNTQSNR